MMKPPSRYLEAVNQQLNRLTPDVVDPYPSFDLPPIYTLVSHPPSKIKNSIGALSEELCSKLSDSDYYYPTPQIHTTLQFIGTVINDDMLSVIRSILKDQRLAVVAYGVGINSRGVSVPIYERSDNNLIARLRQELRSALGISVDYTEHNQIWEQLMWASFSRFKQRPSKEQLDIIRIYRNNYIGDYVINEWQLYKTSSRVLDLKKSELTEVFR